MPEKALERYVKSAWFLAHRPYSCSSAFKQIHTRCSCTVWSTRTGRRLHENDFDIALVYMR